MRQRVLRGGPNNLKQQHITVFFSHRDSGAREREIECRGPASVKGK